MAKILSHIRQRNGSSKIVKKIVLLEEVATQIRKGKYFRIMKIIKNASGKTILKITKAEWQKIGQEQEWIPSPYESPEQRDDPRTHS